MTNETIKVILGVIGFIIIVLLINDYNVSKDNDDKNSVILNDKKNFCMWSRNLRNKLYL